MLKKLYRDERGQIIIMFTIMVPVIMGMIGLALEGGRFLMMHSQLQNLADAAALAGANKLNEEPGAISAARAAVLDYGTRNYPWWANAGPGGNQIDPTKIHICSSLNPYPTPGCVETNDDKLARYVQVTTVQRGVLPAFLVALSSTLTEYARATATAESSYVACNVQPLMMCNPYNGSFAGNAVAGDLFGFTIAGSSTLSSGAFGLLDPAGQTTSGASDIAANLSESSPNFCYADDVSPHTGDPTSAIYNGINVRFQIVPNPTKGLDLTPAPNIIKGDQDSTCSSNPKLTSDDDPTLPPLPRALPVDLGMTTQTPSGATGSTYMDARHFPNQFNLAGANVYWQSHHDPKGSWPTSGGVPLTRYQVYQMERANPPGSGGMPWITPVTENPTPTTAAKCPVPAGGDDRRMIDVAIINCNPPIQGNSLKSVRSNSYAEFFLIRPVDGKGQNTTPKASNYKTGVIWAEFVQMMTPTSTGSKLHHIVDLVRDF